MEKKLKELREERGLSRTELARLVGCHLSNLCDWEKGKTYPSLRFRTELARVFQCELADLQKEKPKNRIHGMRLAKGITQEELAQRLGKTQSEVSLWENEGLIPSMVTLKAMAEVFECRWSALVEDADTVTHIAVPEGENQILYIRKVRKLTQRKLGEMVGCGKSNISKWENGQTKPSVASLIKLASCLNCSIEDLV